MHESLVGLLERGIAKVDGVRALERRLGWSAGGISQSRADVRHISPFRAGQVADLGARILWRRPLRPHKSSRGRQRKWRFGRTCADARCQPVRHLTRLICASWSRRS